MKNQFSQFGSTLSSLGLAFVLVAFCGCSTQLSHQSTIELEIGDIDSVIIAAVGHEQKIKVQAESVGAAVNAHIYLFEDEEAVERAITLKSVSDKILAKQLNANEISLEATIPANKEASVRFETAAQDSAKISVSITN